MILEKVVLKIPMVGALLLIESLEVTQTNHLHLIFIQSYTL